MKQCWFARLAAGAIMTGALLVVAVRTPARAAEWHVAPNGTEAGRGTIQSPWDIASALGGQQRIAPGDIVYLRAGTYRRRPDLVFTVTLVGKAAQPIHIRPAPGERVTIDGGLAIKAPSAHLWFWDLEILTSEPRADPSRASFADPRRPAGGVDARDAVNCRYINLVIHDNNGGIGLWQGARESEVHGCLIYNNGWHYRNESGELKGTGHGLYTQNDTGLKTISDCIFAHGYAYGLHAWGHEGRTNNFLIEGNIAYEDRDGFIVGGEQPSSNLRVLSNFLYGEPLSVGYGFSDYNESCEVRNNVILNGDLSIHRFRQVINEGNLVIPRGSPRPEGTRSMLRINKYDPNRAHLAIFNWQKAPTVAIEAGAFLREGDRYRLMDPRNFYGAPVLTGTYDGSAIRVPMSTVGMGGGEFGAFVLLKQPPS